MKKGNKELLDKFNKGLANVKTSGEYEQILKKWNQTVPEGMVLPKNNCLNKQPEIISDCW